MLNKKLKAIASLIPENLRVIDVGCDHALLDIYLTLNNNNKCIATDINENALSIAENNINKYNLQDKIKTVLTDGLENIDIKENDYVVIAGMGTTTILNIINEKNINNLIISSNNQLELLRSKLIDRYTIVEELLVEDRKKYYVIFKLKKGKSKLTKKQLFLGIKKFNNDNYYEELLNKYSKINSKIPKSKIITKLRLKKRIKYIKSVQ